MKRGFLGVENKNKREISYKSIIGNHTRDDNVCTYPFIMKIEMNGKVQNILKYLKYIFKVKLISPLPKNWKDRSEATTSLFRLGYAAEISSLKISNV